MLLWCADFELCVWIFSSLTSLCFPARYFSVQLLRLSSLACSSSSPTSLFTCSPTPTWIMQKKQQHTEQKSEKKVKQKNVLETEKSTSIKHSFAFFIQSSVCTFHSLHANVERRRRRLELLLPFLEWSSAFWWWESPSRDTDHRRLMSSIDWNLPKNKLYTFFESLSLGLAGDGFFSPINSRNFSRYLFILNKEKLIDLLEALSWLWPKLSLSNLWWAVHFCVWRLKTAAADENKRNLHFMGKFHRFFARWFVFSWRLLFSLSIWL